MRSIPSTVFLCLLATVLSSFPDDWPQWLGPERDSVWREQGIIKEIPKEGLTVKWRHPVGLGYSGPAVSGGKVYVLDYELRAGRVRNDPGARIPMEGKERVLCLDAETGRQIWKYEYPQLYSLSYPSGPRCTPTIDSGKVYALGAEGRLSCLDAESGELIWKRDFKKDFGIESPIWGFASHPLVYGDAMYCVVGGKGSVAVAFDKNTGKEIWRALSAEEPGYCPPSLIKHGGAHQLLIWHPEALNSLDPATGEVFWKLPLKPAYSMSIVPPRKAGNYLFATAIGNVGALIRLDDSKPAAEIVWRGNPKSAVYCVNSVPFINDGVIYGCDVESSALMGVRLEDGKRLWQSKQPTIGEAGKGRHGTAFIVRHEDRYFLFSEQGDLILADLSAQGYRELGRFHVLEPTNEVSGRKCVWSHPAYAEKSLFARNDKEIVCVDLAAAE